ncbi:MAG TPA: M20 family metallopeptidase [Puia sp.]|nr:M20 family metallopeptidase [Puia sp.]
METQLFEKLVDIRRHLHRFPELGFTEFKTSAFIETQLGELAIPTEKIAVTGLIGTLKKGEGPTVILRADMDALPVVEPADAPIRSQNEGVMHACGHDLHMTMLLGAAHLLTATDFQGTIKFVFQPSEEGNARSPVKGKSGGQLIMESGKLDDGKAILGLHVHPLLPVGTLGYKNGEALANVGNFSIHIKGKGGHPGAMKHVIDPIAVTAQVIAGAHALVGPQPDPPSAVLAITHLESLAPPSFNVIPSEVLLQGSMRAHEYNVYQDIVARMHALFQTLEQQSRCTIGLDFSAYYPSLVNDAHIHEKLKPIQKAIFGENNVVPSLAYLVGEDFSFYSRKMPGQFYFLGAKTTKNDAFFLHHPQVTFNEDCIKYGAPLLAQGALRLLQTT